MQATFKQTRLDGAQVLTTTSSLAPLAADPNNRVEMQAVNIYTDVTDQVFNGIGGAATEAAAYVFSQMPTDQQDKLLDFYFGADGANYQYLRVSVDSCDFALGHYEAMSDRNDREMKSFSLERDHKYVIPFLRAAEKKAGRKLPLMLSPWSPPAFMKDSGERNHGGHLLPEYREFWADYLCRYIREYKALGFEIKWLTVQNEANAVQTWDSCNYSGEDEKDFVHNYLYPAMQREGLTDISILVWDHNKERVYERALASIDESTRNEIAGMAFHWYTGDHFEALDLVRRRFPDKQLVYSEGCVEFSRFESNNQIRHGRMYAHEYIGNLKHGASTLIDWNLYLDEIGGPNHVQNYCAAPVMCNLKTGEIMPQLSYHYIKVLGQAIQPGAVRLETSAYTDQLDTVAFRNPDGSCALILLNKGEQALEINLRFGHDCTACTVEGNAIASVVFTA